MEELQKPLRGQLRLCFTQAARTSLLLLRLNDAALRALQECQRQQVRPVIAFQGHRGYLRLPGPGWSCLFSFIVSQCCQEGAGGSLDLVCQRFLRSGPNSLHCLGSLRERLIICAAMDSIPAPSSVQGHNLTEDARHPESWQNTGGYSEGDAVSQPQMALEEKRSVPVATVELEEKRFRTLPLAPSPLQGLTNQDLQEGEDWEQEDEDMDPRLEHSSSVQEDSESPSPEDIPDYLLQYRAIHSAEQQHAYEQDFETDYAEYRILHARVGTASQRFIELGAEIKRVRRGTPEYKVLEDKIIQEYKKFRKQYPSYREEKRRCEYLHQKLSHIKGLILEFEEKNRGS
nr:RNA polymerase II elongation factor ELL3 isoform X2 [Pan paniscus]